MMCIGWNEFSKVVLPALENLIGLSIDPLVDNL